MITETARTQQLPFTQPEQVRTPEEILVTILAQTIIITSNPKPEMPVLERPFGMEKQQDGGKERTSENRETTQYSKSDSKESSEPKSEQTTTATVKPSDIKQHSDPKKLTGDAESNRSLEIDSENENRAPRSREGMKSSTKPTLTKSQETPLSQMNSLRHENSRVAEEKGTSRRQMMSDQPLQHASAQNSLFQRVNKDREQSPHKKRDFKRVENSKVVGSEKVERVAQKRFQPEKSDDFESFLRTMMQDSDLSGFFGVRVSHFDVMLLFIELMKLEVEDNHQERTARLEERRYQIVWMESVVKQYKSQAKLLLFAGVGAGVLGVLSGALPIIGHVGGDFILDKLKMVYSGFEGMKRAKVFDNLSKMCFSMSEMNKAMGQVQSSFCEGERSWAEHKSSLHRTDGEESTRTIEERTREFKNWTEILAQLLRMEQDLVRQLYS